MLRYLSKTAILSFLITFFFVSTVSNVFAYENVLGVHILQPQEIDAAKDLITSENDDEWQYLTIPLTLNDLEKHDEWQEFFNKARERKIIPLVRLATRFENGSWQRPNRKELVSLVGFLSKLDWPTDKKHIIVFNEVNHAKEWGGQVDPASYAETLAFVSSWARSENNGFVILPAAMDLAAPNFGPTREAFSYLSELYQIDDKIFDSIDVWNSHSYPNPGFSSPPTRTGQNSLIGFRYELDFLKNKTGKDFDVFITETGWEENPSTSRWLESYYTYALQHIWSDSRVVAVTPFVLQGAPGPFEKFSFLDGNSQPTKQYKALQAALKNMQS